MNRQALLPLLILTLAGNAQAADLSQRCAGLRVGDPEERILQTIDEPPRSRTRSELAGVERSVLVFAAGSTTCTVTLLFGRLVGRTVEERPTRWLPRWLPS